VQEEKVEHKRIIAKIKNLGLKRFLSRMVGNDRGVVLVFALVLMLVLTIIGSSATMTSQIDLKISGNTKVIRTSFYVADGGIMMSPKVISRIISDRALPSASETPLLAYDDYAAAVGEDPVLLKKRKRSWALQWTALIKVPTTVLLTSRWTREHSGIWLSI
jgi:hypothetical protein